MWKTINGEMFCLVNSMVTFTLKYNRQENFYAYDPKDNTMNLVSHRLLGEIAYSKLVNVCKTNLYTYRGKA